MSIISYSVGSLLVGSWFSVAMYGSMSFQAVRFLRMNNDPAPWLRILVSVLWFLDTLHVIFICHSLYFFLITSQATEPNVHLIPWSLAATVAVTAAITLIVQLFFARRIWILSRELRLVVVLIVATAVTRVVFACITTSRAIIIGNLPEFAPLVPFLVTTGLTLSVATDLLVTGALCWYLSRQRTGFETDSLIDKIMRWTVQNGAMTSFFAILSLVTAVIMPHNLVWLGIHLIISKCYTTSTIAHLNAKEVERELRMQQAELNHGLHLPRNGSYSAGSKNAERSAAGPVVTVSKDVFVEISEKGHEHSHSIGNKSSNDSLNFNAV